MTYQTAITTDDAHLDIRARGFWSAAQDAYFDVRVFHPNAPRNSSGTIPAMFRKHENIKKRVYGQRVRDVEHGVLLLQCFPPLGEWVMKPPHSIKGLKICSLPSDRSPIPLLSVG